MVDLHSHSTASDGELSPASLVDLACESGISALALTDHDTTSGLDEAVEQAKKRNICLIPGVELDIDFRPGEFHLLGLGLKNYREGELARFLADIRERRNKRNTEMIFRMQADGVPISLEELKKGSEKNVIGRLHIARRLIELKMASSVPEVFERWLGPGKPYYVAKDRPSLEEALRAIHGAGGKAVVAHPMSLWLSWGRLARNLEEWTQMGLDGVEARHSGASRTQARRLEELARQNGLFITGGSDFHGSSRPDRKLGYGAEGKTIPDSFLDPFRSFCQ